ncbi:hypothetical protein F4778DRAFT_732725 [Xylariomycetidae sp. FL2044]|nr:hypothetical protein F4778DRAFT_732725 [Xylariomycetidae sp. FL2044]
MIRRPPNEMHADPYKMYVLVQENILARGPRFEVLTATTDLELANESGLAEFRRACYELFPRLMEDPFDPFVEHGEQDDWYHARGDIRSIGKLAWWISGDSTVALSAAMPGRDEQITVRVVTAQVVVREE